MTYQAAAVSEHTEWQEQNRGFLAAALDDLRLRLNAPGAFDPAGDGQSAGDWQPPATGSRPAKAPTRPLSPSG